ncbi:polyprenol monophosphomannose synthase [Dietzia sp.]|uniref:polyprenol monophosphomannose synthase n=1 Tax=Dietzia sp. TaxID=1871616 RepID=UPI002FDA6B2B
MSRSTSVVIMPTYNEAENLEHIVADLFRHVPATDLLIADDNSPDGTGGIADELAASDPEGRISVLHRAGKEGLGAAYIAGFRWALEHGYEIVVEMDADGSHPPKSLPTLLGAVEQGADLAIGSRYVPGGKIENWPLSRHVISRGGNFYSRFWLGIGVNDITAGYRAYRASALAALDFDAIDSAGYCFQIDMTLRFFEKGFRIVEVPITFVERTVGTSKMSESIFREAALNVPKWGIERRRTQVRGLLGKN